MSELINKVWKQIGEDIDGEATNDNSGYSVSLSSDGNTVAIGAPFNDGKGNNSGHVRIYQYNSSNKKWTQIGEDIDGKASDFWSGNSVSLSTNCTCGFTRVAIGAPFNYFNNSNSGYVRVYQYNPNYNKWIKIGQDINGKSNNDRNGYSVSLSNNGEIVAIGSPNNDNGIDSGYVRIYHSDNNIWNQIGKDIKGEYADDRSGFSVSLNYDGKTVAIGAHLNDGNDKDSGHVRVYKYNSDNNIWNQIGKDIDGEASNDLSGRSVSLSSDGQIVAIGAIWNKDNGLYSGHVRVYQYDLDNDNWVQLGKDIDGEANNVRNGYSVSLSSNGKTLAIGAIYNKGHAGNVKIYQYHKDEWTQIGNDINGEFAWDNSGFSVSLSSDGETVAVGAYQNDGNGINSGHVRVYKLETEQNKRKIINNLGLIAAGIYAVKKILK